MVTRREFLRMAAALGSCMILPTSLIRAGFDPLWKEGQPVDRPIDISVFEMFKIGPGPSSSHTIAPMKAGNDFFKLMHSLPAETLQSADSIVVHLYGSLADTGLGHGIHKAITAGLLGVVPEEATAELMDDLYNKKGDTYTIQCGHVTLPFSMKNFIFETKKIDAPYSNVMTFVLKNGNETLLEREYYSVGGGFLQWKGWKEPDRGTPVHRFDSMNSLLACMAATGKNLPTIMIENEQSITGMHPEAVRHGLLKFIDAMNADVESGLSRTGLLKGPFKLERRAAGMYAAAKKLHKEDAFMAKINAYAHAAAEENADGHPIVTSPTAGSAGVMPAIIRALIVDRHIPRESLVNGMLAAAVVGMLAKRHASIAGADVGCQGEIGVSSSMSAALIAQTLDGDPTIVENAAEIALEHHLGMTCDPVGGYVQIPCISRCAMGAVKAWNAYVMAETGKTTHDPVGLDLTIRTMNATGRDMNEKYRETAKGGLALFYTQKC